MTDSFILPSLCILQSTTLHPLSSRKSIYVLFPALHRKTGIDCYRMSVSGSDVHSDHGRERCRVFANYYNSLGSNFEDRIDGKQKREKRKCTKNSRGVGWCPNVRQSHEASTDKCPSSDIIFALIRSLRSLCSLRSGISY